MALKTGKKANLTFSDCEKIAYDCYKKGKKPDINLLNKLYDLKTITLINKLYELFLGLYKTFLAASSAVKHAQINIANSKIKDAYNNITLANNKIQEHRNLIKYYKHLFTISKYELKFYRSVASDFNKLIKFKEKEYNEAETRYNNIRNILDDEDIDEQLKDALINSLDKNNLKNSLEESKKDMEVILKSYADTNDKITNLKLELHKYNALRSIESGIVKDERARIELLTEYKQQKITSVKIFDILLNLSFL